MEPQPQLQPVNPKPQLQYAEPPARPLELKPGPRPLDLRPRPSARPQLDIKYGPASPAEQAAARANPLGNPLRVADPVLNNPLGYVPGKGVVSFAAGLLQNATDPATFGVPADEFEPSGLGELVSTLPLDALYDGNPIAETPPGEIPAGVVTLVNFTGTILSGSGQPESWDSGPLQILGYFSSVTARERTESPFNAPSGTYGLGILVFSAGQTIALFYSNVGFRGISGAVVGYLRDGQPYQPPTGEVERAPNPARAALAPTDLPEPGTRDQETPFLPIPTFRLPVLPESPEFVPYEPPSEVDLPEIRPVNPGRPSAPTKFPPPATAPELPGTLDDPNTDRTGRKLIPPFIPVLPGTTPPEILPPTKTPPFIIPIPPLRRNDCCADEAVMRESQRIRDILDDLKDRILEDCQDLCGPALMTTTECQEVNGKLQPVSVFRNVLTLSEGLEVLAAEIAAINQQLNPCGGDGAENVPPVLIASGSMSAGSTVKYVDVADDVQQVELIITGTIPNDLRLYDTTLAGEQQGKFGSICVAFPGVVGGNAPDAFHQWAWTRRTLLNLSEPTRPGRKVRIFLRAGLSWVLYDTGVRK